MKAIYPGTFDPVTAGHLDIVRRASVIFEEVEVAVVHDTTKGVTFGASERVRMVLDSLREASIEGSITVTSFDGLLVDYMRASGCSLFIRGLRANSDFEYEFQMQLMNRRLAPEVTGVYLMPSERNMYVSSTVVKEVARCGGPLETFVTPSVERALKDKYRRNR
jgi:pantetheine-phosphate adenylyltransferase